MNEPSMRWPLLTTARADSEPARSMRLMHAVVVRRPGNRSVSVDADAVRSLLLDGAENVDSTMMRVMVWERLESSLNAVTLTFRLSSPRAMNSRA